MIKDLILNSPLQNSEKHLANHSAIKALVKKLKQQQVLKSEIINITGHNLEADLDAYDSGDEFQQKKLSHFIINPQLTTSKKKCFNYSNNPKIQRIHRITLASNPFSFNNCTVHFHMDDQIQNISSSVANTQKPIRFEVIRPKKNTAPDY